MSRDAPPRCAKPSVRSTRRPWSSVSCQPASRAAREEHWEEHDEQGRKVDRTLGFAHLGGATLDNEENYLLKKLYTAMGAIQIENQARI